MSKFRGSVHAGADARTLRSQLAPADDSVTLSPTTGAQNTFDAATGIQASDSGPEFAPVTDTAPALAADASASALGLDRMRVVNLHALGSQALQSPVDYLRSRPGVADAEPVWLQSSDPKYLSCNYKVSDGAAAVPSRLSRVRPLSLTA